jgi:hypothetical protein
MRSFGRCFFASRASISASARCGAIPPHLVARAFLDRFGIRPDSADAYAFTCIEFEKGRREIRQARRFCASEDAGRPDAQRGRRGRALLLDGGDLWQGTGLSNTLQGADMVDAANLLGIEAMTGHWEFTYGEKALRANLERFKGEFLAQNVFLTEEAAFNDAKAFDPASGRVFKPSVIKEIGGHRVRRDRAGIPLRADRAPQAFHAGLEIRHPRRRAAKARRCQSQHRQGRCRHPALA